MLLYICIFVSVSIIFVKSFCIYDVIDCHRNIFVLAEEFVAHAGNVNCVALGHNSGRVFVSGGEDQKVNLWAVGKSKCILVCETLFSNL